MIKEPKEIESAKQLIDLATKTKTHTMKALNCKVRYKRLGSLEGVVYQAEGTSEMLLFFSLCNSKGKRLFKDIEEAKIFEEAIPMVDYPKLLSKLRHYNFPTMDDLSKNS